MVINLIPWIQKWKSLEHAVLEQFHCHGGSHMIWLLDRSRRENWLSSSDVVFSYSEPTHKPDVLKRSERSQESFHCFTMCCIFWSIWGGSLIFYLDKYTFAIIMNTYPNIWFFADPLISRKLFKQKKKSYLYYNYNNKTSFWCCENKFSLKTYNVFTHTASFFSQIC